MFLPRSIACASLLLLAHAAPAQNTRLVCEASTNYGLSWHPSVDIWPVQRADIRVRCELIDAPAGLDVFGLAGLISQPTLTHWIPALGDRPLPFTFPGLNAQCAPTWEPSYSGRHIHDSQGFTGRIAPFGASGQGPDSSTGLLTSFSDPSATLRFAGSKNATPATNPAWGLASVQAPPATGGTNFQPSLNVVVFKYAFVIGTASTQPRTMTAAVPRELIFSGTGGMGPAASWYLNQSGTSSLAAPIRPQDIIAATIHVRARCSADLSGSTLPSPQGPSSPPIPGPDGAVTIDDLLYFLTGFEAGSPSVDLDNGSNTGTPDNAVTIDDLLFFLTHFEAGC